MIMSSMFQVPRNSVDKENAEPSVLPTATLQHDFIEDTTPSLCHMEESIHLCDTENYTFDIIFFTSSHPMTMKKLFGLRWHRDCHQSSQGV